MPCGQFWTTGHKSCSNVSAAASHIDAQSFLNLLLIPQRCPYPKGCACINLIQQSLPEIFGALIVRHSIPPSSHWFRIDPLHSTDPGLCFIQMFHGCFLPGSFKQAVNLLKSIVQTYSGPVPVFGPALTFYYNNPLFFITKEPHFKT